MEVMIAVQQLSHETVSEPLSRLRDQSSKTARPESARGARWRPPSPPFFSARPSRVTRPAHVTKLGGRLHYRRLNLVPFPLVRASPNSPLPSGGTLRQQQQFRASSVNSCNTSSEALGPLTANL